MATLLSKWHSPMVAKLVLDCWLGVQLELRARELGLSSCRNIYVSWASFSSMMAEFRSDCHKRERKSGGAALAILTQHQDLHSITFTMFHLLFQTVTKVTQV
jgi:hypothetical protein